MGSERPASACGNIVTIYANYSFETEVLVASVRLPIHVLQAALLGTHVATPPFKVIQRLVQHPLTEVSWRVSWRMRARDRAVDDRVSSRDREPRR